MRTLLLSTLVLSAISCHATHPPATVNHVVICWLKAPGDESARKQVMDATDTLRKIPGVVSVTAGRPISSTRPVVDSSFDVGIVMTFKDEAALHAYETNPIHIKARNEVLRPLASKFVIYDIKKEADAAKAPASTGTGSFARNPVVTIP